MKPLKKIFFQTSV